MCFFFAARGEKFSELLRRNFSRRECFTPVIYSDLSSFFLLVDFTSVIYVAPPLFPHPSTPPRCGGLYNCDQQVATRRFSDNSRQQGVYLFEYIYNIYIYSVCMRFFLYRNMVVHLAAMKIYRGQRSNSGYRVLRISPPCRSIAGRRRRREQALFILARARAGVRESEIAKSVERTTETGFASQRN